MAVRIQPLYRKRQYQGQEWGQPRSRAVQTIKNYNSTITNISSFKSLPYREGAERSRHEKVCMMWEREDGGIITHVNMGRTRGLQEK